MNRAGFALWAVCWVVAGAPGCVNLDRPQVLSVLDGGNRLDGDASGDRPGGNQVDRPLDMMSTDARDVGDPDIDIDMAAVDADIPDVPGASGTTCSADTECASGICVAGICCDKACAGTCESCSLASSLGTCMPVPDGQDPKNECAAEPLSGCGRDGACNGQGACRLHAADTECAPARCAGTMAVAASRCNGGGACIAGASQTCGGGASCVGGRCPMSCTMDNQCAASDFCGAGSCQAKRARGQTCSAARECSSGFCVDGYCCNTTCGELCRSCAVAGSLGTCVPVPDGLDPRNVCATESASSCRLDGFCDGRGACGFHPAGTVCGTASCAAGVEQSAPTCNGAGTCAPSMIRACGAYQCGGNVCATTCLDSTQCTAGHACSGNRCQPLPAPTLHWRFDDAAGGTTAADSSGNGLAGTFIGTLGTPITSQVEAPVIFANPASRQFTRANRHAVRLAPIPSAFKNGAELTVSVWYLTSSLDSEPGSEILGGGDNFVVRLRPAGLAAVVRHNPGGGAGYVLCQSNMTNHIDGNWHHAAVVFSASEMRVYFDGALTCSAALGSTVVFDRGTDMYVGRHGNADVDWDFEGLIDDVRIYTRVLSAEQIAALARGR